MGNALIFLKEETQGKKLFEIVETTEPYQPQEKIREGFHADETLSSRFGDSGEATHQLYITPQARNQLFQHIGWGQTTEQNQVEQGGILVGHVYRDCEQGILYGVVEQAIVGTYAKGSSAYLEIDHRAWKAMVDQVDEMLDAEPENDLQIIGWFHTHPNGLSVFMSGTDRATQRRIFARDWQFAIVLNPQKREWCAFYGKDAKECLGFMINDH